MNPDSIASCDPREELGRLLRKAREQKHLSQHEVAVRLFISRPEVSKMEAGIITIPVIRFIKYCLIVDICPSHLIIELKEIITPPR